MKQLILALFLLLSTQAFAAYNRNLPKTIELCAMEDADEAEKNFIEKRISIARSESLSRLQLQLVNDYLIQMEYTEYPLSFQQIQKAFGRGGKESSLDLGLHFITSRKTGKKYYQVISYPGDNPVGRYYDETGRMVATNEDGSISIVIGSKTPYCGDIQK